MTLCYSYWG